jgi:hypothetical protein
VNVLRNLIDRITGRAAEREREPNETLVAAHKIARDALAGNGKE